MFSNQQQPQHQPQNRFAFFSNNDPSKKYVASLIINVTPELLQEMLQMAQATNWAVNQYGQLEHVKLSGWMYNNEGKYGGNVTLSQPQQQYQAPQQYALQPQPQPQYAPQPQQQYAPQPQPPTQRKFGGLT